MVRGRAGELMERRKNKEPALQPAPVYFLNLMKLDCLRLSVENGGLACVRI